ncbi:proline racemase family protein [Chloroflexus aurantiacus]
MKLDWDRLRLPPDTLRITTIETHTAGEPLRIVTGGVPDIIGTTILERRRFMRDHLDYIRRALMWEPRGHFNMYGCVLTPPVSAEADVGVLFMHNEGYSTMCGHGVIALVTVLVESGAVAREGDQATVTLDTPAGLVRATAHLDSGSVIRVSFRNVPSFVYARDLQVHVPGYGQVVCDVAWGGAFYAVLPAAQLGLRVTPEQTAALVAAGEAVKRAVSEVLPLHHPLDPDLDFLYGTILTDQPEDAGHHSRNICVFANAEVDRSPTGTGVSARLAIHYAKGEIAADEEIVIESILGRHSTFSGRVVDCTRVGSYPAIIPEVSGQAFVIGRSEFIVDPRDQLGGGFLVEQIGSP